MKYVTLIHFIVRAGVLAGIFVFIQSPEDLLALPALNAVGALIGALLALYLMHRDGVRICRVGIADAILAARRSTPLFGSNFVAAISDKGGALVVGAVLGPAQLAYYDLAEKLMGVGAMVYYNAARAIYPNIAKSGDKAVSRSLCRWIIAGAIVSVLVLVLMADWLVVVFAGSPMAPSGIVLEVLAIYLLFAASGPLMANVLLIADLHDKLLWNTTVASVGFLAGLFGLWTINAFTIESVAVVFVASALVRNVHRYAIVRRAGLTHWLH